MLLRRYPARTIPLTQCRDELFRFVGQSLESVFTLLLPMLSDRSLREETKAATSPEISEIDRDNTVAGLQKTSVVCPVVGQIYRPLPWFSHPRGSFELPKVKTLAEYEDQRAIQ